MAEQESFEAAAHQQVAVTAYLKRYAFYRDLAAAVTRILDESLKGRAIKVQSVQGRAKDPTSLGEKAAQPLDGEPTRPKYPRPLEQITDLAGVRVITYFPSTLVKIDRLLEEEFIVVERSDKGAQLIEEDRFGYQSIHYLVKLTPIRARLPEYIQFANVLTEIQVRTVLQHAWAEIEHDIQYKSAAVIPAMLRRRFMSLAGMLEIADREFQAIQDADEQLTRDARTRVASGHLEQVEITPDAIKAFLDQRLGPDGRMTDFSYDWTARLLKRLGFKTLVQVETCIRGYNDDALSRMVTGSRQGQTARFEFMLLAGMGELYIQRHTFADEPMFVLRLREQYERLQAGRVELRQYDPVPDGSVSSPVSVKEQTSATEQQDVERVAV